MTRVLYPAAGLPPGTTQDAIDDELNEWAHLGPAQYDCQWCGRVFDRIAELDAHMDVCREAA